MKFPLAASVTLLFILLDSALSQESFYGPPSHASIGVSVGTFPQSKLENGRDGIESKYAAISASIPVWNIADAGDDGITLHQFSLTGSYRKTSMSLLQNYLVPPPAERTITSARLGASWRMARTSNDIYSLSGSVGFAQDKLIDDTPDVRFRLTALAAHRMSVHVGLSYGITYSDGFGRELLLPLFGVQWKMNNDWSSTILLPFSLSVRYAAGEHVALRAALSTAGDQMTIGGSSGCYSESLAPMQLRITGAKVSTAILGKISSSFGIHFETGVFTGRSIGLAHFNTGPAETLGSVRASGFVTAGIQYIISTSGKDDEPM